MDKKIDFIVPGFPKCGTTWLFHQLSKLPDFEMPFFKEIHYFDRSIKYLSSNFLSVGSPNQRIQDIKFFERNIEGISRIGLNLVKLKFYKANQLFKWYFGNYNDDQWYFSLFDESNSLKGDVTPTYCLLDNQDLRDMASLLPNNIKIIFIIRNPVDRAWSQYRMMLVKNYKFLGDSLTTVQGKINFLKSEREIERSNYLESINRFKKHFPNSEILITFFDVLQENPRSFLTNIVEFLGGDVKNIKNLPGLEEKVHKSLEEKMPIEIENLLKKQYKLLMLNLMNEYGGYCKIWYQDLFEEFESRDTIFKSEFLLI